MAKQTTSQEVSLGTCNFCQETFAKSKITQHLKSCKVRQASIKNEEGEKERLFHIQVEGQYRPAYWMHVEIPAAATLAELDDFLRYMWLECCDHLSEFEINGESYSYEPDDMWGSLPLSIGAADEAEHNHDHQHTEEEEEEEEDEEGASMPGMEEIATEMSRQLAQDFGTDLKNVPAAQIEKRLEEMFAENMPAGMSAGMLPMLRPLLGQLAQSLQQGTLAEELAEMEAEEEEDGGMNSELGDVLEVGQKFSYVYDFGSSSTLALRVVAEREGVVPTLEEDEEDTSDDTDEEELEEDEDEFEDEDEELVQDELSIFIMARNDPPALVCHICGQPATRVPSASEYDSLAEIALCTTHAAQTESPDDLLPIVNSPRTGICGYAGNEFELEWEDEGDEEDEEDEEE